VSATESTEYTEAQRRRDSTQHQSAEIEGQGEGLWSLPKTAWIARRQIRIAEAVERAESGHSLFRDDYFDRDVEP
jgi:hypothetical protein